MARMDWMFVALAASALWLLTLWLWLRYARAARVRLRTLQSAKQSLSTRYGQITEQFAPFLADWPWDPKAFRFIGSPVDGIQFTEDAVVFVEIKSARSRLSPEQRRIRELVQAGRIEWREVRIE
jgi:predicted Holliday junction resolvase-like endonuclease